MFAIVEIAGLQYKVEQDQKLFVNRLAGDKGAKVSFDKVLLTSNGTVTVGAPAVEGVAVEAEILDHVQADKVIVFKKKRRKGYKVKNGHRQQLTQIQITSITGFSGGAKKSAKETAKPEATGADRETVVSFVITGIVMIDGIDWFPLGKSFFHSSLLFLPESLNFFYTILILEIISTNTS